MRAAIHPVSRAVGSSSVRCAHSPSCASPRTCTTQQVHNSHSWMHTPTCKRVHAKAYSTWPEHIPTQACSRTSMGKLTQRLPELGPNLSLHALSEPKPCSVLQKPETPATSCKAPGYGRQSIGAPRHQALLPKITLGPQALPGPVAPAPVTLVAVFLSLSLADRGEGEASDGHSHVIVILRGGRRCYCPQDAENGLQLPMTPYWGC